MLPHSHAYSPPKADVESGKHDGAKEKSANNEKISIRHAS